MVLSFDRLQAIRDCCRDEAAFLRLQQLLTLPVAPPPPPSNLLQGVAEATSQLLTSSDFTAGINTALATLGQATAVDRVYIFEAHPHPETQEPAVSQRFEWVRETVTPQLENPDLQNRVYLNTALHRWYEILAAGQSFSSIVRELPPAEQAFLVIQDILSVLIVPIHLNGHLWGLIGFDDCHSERQWSQDEEAALLLMAASIGGAIVRQQTEEALRQSQTRLQTIAANVPGMIYQFLQRTDDSRQLLYASPGAQELLELQAAAIEGNIDLLSSLCHPNDRDSFERSVAGSAQTLQPWRWQGRIITPSGKLKWIEGFSRPERQPNGDLLWDGIAVDITNRMQAETDRLLSEERYKAMLDASPDLMFRLNRAGKYLDFKGNSDAEVPREDIVGRDLSELLPPDVAELSLRAIQQTLDTGTLQTCKYRLPSSRGLRDYEARIVVCGKDEVLTVVQDVTDRQRFESDLRASEERLQAFFNATFEAVVIHDFDRILDVNPAAVQLFGYSCDEMIGMPVLRLVAPNSLETVRQKWRSLTSPDQSYDYEAWGQKQDGTLFMAAVCSKVIDYQGQRLRVAGIRDITENKLVEQAIRQSEARNRALVNAIPDLMFRIRRDGTYLDCKAESDSDVLMPPHALIGKTVYQVLPPDLAAQRMHYVEQALATGEIQHFEYQLRLNNDRAAALYGHRADSSPDHSNLRHYEARVVVSGEDEVLAIVRDITDRKCSEAALRLSEEKFSKAFRSSPNPMSIASLEAGRLIEVNDSFLQAIGYERTEVLGRTVHELQLWANPADRVRMTQLLRQHGTLRNFECQFRSKSGAIFTTLFSADVINISGELCLIDVAVDITDRLRAEQQLWAAAERDRLLGEIALRIRQSLELEQILDTTVAEVRLFLGADRVFIGINADQGKNQVVAESVAPEWQPMLGQVNPNQQHLQEIRTLFAHDQTLVVNDTAQFTQYPAIAAHYAMFQVRAALGVPLTLNNQMFGLLVVHQCSAPRQWQPFEVNLLERLATQVTIAIQQAQLYRQVQDLNTGLERQVAERTAQLQQKMEELQELNALKDEFLNAFTHDLRTPVMGISLVINNMLNQTGDPIPVTRSILERMVQSSDHQLQLLNSLLQASSSETQGVILHYELVQLSLLTQIVVEDLEPLVTKYQALFENQVPPDLPLVKADPMQLRRVFENLLTNALHHNPPGIKLTLQATVEEEMIRFTLQDNGVGMPPDLRDRLFDRYARGRNSRHSTGIGLGLYLCRQIVTAHGGQIGVNSTPGGGSSFWLTLPLAIPSVAQPNPAAIADA
jgi:PAS domain S-box-containing protein